MYNSEISYKLAILLAAKIDLKRSNLARKKYWKAKLSYKLLKGETENE